MQYSQEFLYQLASANPIEDVIGSYCRLVRQGRNKACVCPFHADKNPSLVVYPDSQSFFCFGCHAGGDVFNFIKQIEGVEFPEAVSILAQRAGMELPKADPETARLAERKTRIYEMNRLAANFYFLNLINGKDKSGLKYFSDRRLSPATIKKYGLGYASDSWDELCNYLHSKGYKDDEIVDAWLAGRSRKTGRLFDMFRKRVMFPIVDTRGNIIGFGGRVLDDSTPKYLNTAQTPVFDKGRNLFSYNFAKRSDSKRLILCEGYMDVIAVNQAGFDNVVATLGTAITRDQARMISADVTEVIIAYDGDSAGQAATRKAVNHFASFGITTRILKLEGAKDPDEYIKKFGAARFRMLLDNSDDATVFLLERCELGLDISTELGRVELLNRSVKVLCEIESEMEREVYISRTAEKCRIPSDVIRNNVEAMLKKNVYKEQKKQWETIKTTTTIRRDPVNPDAEKFPREAKAEEFIICYLMRHPEQFDEIQKEAPPEIFVTAFNRRAYEAMLRQMQRSDKFTVSALHSEGFSSEEMGRITGMQVRTRELGVNREVFSDSAKFLAACPKNAPDDDGSNDFLVNLFKSKANI